MAAESASSRHGFTLIEILAVVLIIGLTFGFFLPNLDSNRYRRLEAQAREVANLIHIAREGAITSGAEHRVWIDLEESAMRVDWYVTEERAAAAYGEPTDGTPMMDPQVIETPEISLEPPQTSGRDYFPVASKFGETLYLPLDYFFFGVETPDGFVESGEVQLVFGRDGTTAYSEILLGDAWENELAIEIQPLMDRVYLRRGGEN